MASRSRAEATDTPGSAISPREIEAVAVLRELHELLDFADPPLPGECGRINRHLDERIIAAYARALRLVQSESLSEPPGDSPDDAHPV